MDDIVKYSQTWHTCNTHKHCRGMDLSHHSLWPWGMLHILVLEVMSPLSANGRLSKLHISTVPSGPSVWRKQYLSFASLKELWSWLSNSSNYENIWNKSLLTSHLSSSICGGREHGPPKISFCKCLVATQPLQKSLDLKLNTESNFTPVTYKSISLTESSKKT